MVYEYRYYFRRNHIVLLHLFYSQEESVILSHFSSNIEINKSMMAFVETYIQYLFSSLIYLGKYVVEGYLSTNSNSVLVHDILFPGLSNPSLFLLSPLRKRIFCLLSFTKMLLKVQSLQLDAIYTHI